MNPFIIRTLGVDRSRVEIPSEVPKFVRTGIRILYKQCEWRSPTFYVWVMSSGSIWKLILFTPDVSEIPLQLKTGVLGSRILWDEKSGDCRTRCREGVREGVAESTVGGGMYRDGIGDYGSGRGVGGCRRLRCGEGCMVRVSKTTGRGGVCV